jgi:hypothetical protein
MDAGGHAQSTTYLQTGLGMPTGGLSSRRGGQNIKPLSFDALNAQPVDNGAPTPRTSRSHLLAGLRTAPKTATAASFPNPASPTTALPPQMRARDSMYNGNMYNGPKTSVPSFGARQGYTQPSQYGQQHFTAEQILAPPEIQLEDPTAAENMDPNLYAQLVATNAYLAQQQQRLQQQLMSVQAAAQQFQGLNLGNVNAQPLQQAYQNLYQQQQQVKQAMTAGVAQPNIYAVYDPLTGQQTYYMDQNAVANQLLEQQQQQQYAAQLNMYQQPQAAVMAPRVQVSPPPAENTQPAYRNNSPPRRFESSDEPTPLPPPSANAFRRGHKKASSLALNNLNPAAAATDGQMQPPMSAGPKTATFPLTPLATAGTYGPGQGRAGEHPIRQPRGPPSFDELKSKPTAKYEGSKNFVTRTRRSAVHNLVRAGIERRKGTGSSLGSISPIDESGEELVETPLTDNDSDSGRSGSGSLGGEEAGESSLPSSRTSNASWGAIGSERPRSRQMIKRTGSVDSGCSATDDSERETPNVGNSFASLLKSGGTPKKEVGERKAPMLVLTSAEKRKGNAVLVA